MISESNDNKNLNVIYNEIKNIREHRNPDIIRLKELFDCVSKKFPNDWLSKLEIYEIVYNKKCYYLDELKKSLYDKIDIDSDLSNAIKRSLHLIEK